MLRKICFLFFITINIVSCSSRVNFNKSMELSQPRALLTVEQLQKLETPPLVDMIYFTKPQWAEKASETLSGSLVFNKTVMKTSLDSDNRWVRRKKNIFPSFSIDFVSDGHFLIPIEKRIISTLESRSSFWDVIVGVGKIWKEPNDGVWNRASFPLTLVSRQTNDTKNCVATFLFHKQKISNAYIQCSQESSPSDSPSLTKTYKKADMQAIVQTYFLHRKIKNSEKIIKSYYENRTPIYPLNNIDPKQKIARLFIDDSSSTSLGALVINGDIYMHPPMTRHGKYPYPSEMRHGVYSVTKSLACGLSMFYFAERYGEEIFDAKITDYIPVLANHPGWQNVTFSHVFNMVTGVEGDETSDYLYILDDSFDSENRINNILKLKDLPDAPGEKFEYVSFNSFILSYAMQKFVERKEGANIYYWDLVRENVLKPIGADSLSLQRHRDSDGSKGLPVMGWGAFPTVIETAKIAYLLSNEGKHENQQLLNANKLKEALYHTMSNSYRSHDDWRYRHSFWSVSDNMGKCKRVTFMAGLGGNYVAFFPNNTILIRFRDDNKYDYRSLFKSVSNILKLCY